MIRAVCLVFAALMLVSGPARAETSSWQKAVYHYAKIYKINPCVVFAIIETESSGNPNAVTVNYRRGYRSYRSRRSADHLVKSRYRNMDIGLMQINQYWIDQKLKISKTALLNPLHNIDIGEWLLKNLLNKYNHNYRKAVSAYHSSVPEKGRRYLNKVIRAYQKNRYNCRKAKDAQPRRITKRNIQSQNPDRLTAANISIVMRNSIAVVK